MAENCQTCAYATQDGGLDPCATCLRLLERTGKYPKWQPVAAPRIATLSPVRERIEHAAMRSAGPRVAVVLTPNQWGAVLQQLDRT